MFYLIKLRKLEREHMGNEENFMVMETKRDLIVEISRLETLTFTGHIETYSNRGRQQLFAR